MARERRKVRIGRVVSDKMDKTIIVAVPWQQRHALYRKGLRRITRFYVHDQENTSTIGDLVKIEETRPISLTKRWRILEVLERREVAEVKPAELDEGILTEEEEAKAAEEAVRLASEADEQAAPPETDEAEEPAEQPVAEQVDDRVDIVEAEAVEEATVEEVKELAEQPEAIVEEPPAEEPSAEQVEEAADRVDTVEAKEAQPSESKEEAEEEAPIEQEEVEDEAKDREDKK